VARDPITPSNTLLMASGDRLDGTLLQAAPVPGPLRPLSWTQGGRLRPAARGGRVFTDDRAPVEWLIDASIVKYAAGESK
jgi:hypothetical protein